MIELNSRYSKLACQARYQEQKNQAYLSNEASRYSYACRDELQVEINTLKYIYYTVNLVEFVNL